jgi:hypothetical protein
MKTLKDCQVLSSYQIKKSNADFAAGMIDKLQAASDNGYKSTFDYYIKLFLLLYL